MYLQKFKGCTSSVRTIEKEPKPESGAAEKASDDYCGGKAFFTAPTANPSPGNGDITGSLLPTGNEQRPPCPSSCLFTFYQVFVQALISGLSGNRYLQPEVTWEQTRPKSLALPCTPLTQTCHCSFGTEFNGGGNSIHWEQFLYIYEWKDWLIFTLRDLCECMRQKDQKHTNYWIILPITRKPILFQLQRRLRLKSEAEIRILLLKVLKTAQRQKWCQMYYQFLISSLWSFVNVIPNSTNFEAI